MTYIATAPLVEFETLREIYPQALRGPGLAVAASGADRNALL